jgi:hypothetical protein
LIEIRDYFYLAVPCPKDWHFSKRLEVLAAHTRTTLESFSDNLLNDVVRSDVGHGIYQVAAPLGREFKITLLCAIFSHPGLMPKLSARAGRLVLEFDCPVAADDRLSADEVRKYLEPFRQALLQVVKCVA